MGLRGNGTSVPSVSHCFETPRFTTMRLRKASEGLRSLPSMRDTEAASTPIALAKLDWLVARGRYEIADAVGYGGVFRRHCLAF